MGGRHFVRAAGEWKLYSMARADVGRRRGFVARLEAKAYGRLSTGAGRHGKGLVASVVTMGHVGTGVTKLCPWRTAEWH